MTEKRQLPGARDKLPWWFTPVWSTRSVAVSMNMALSAYQTIYYTNVLGLNPAIIGILLMVSKFADGFTDLLIGFIVDRTHTKLGKARPYEIFISILWLFIYLMYSTPKMDTIWVYIWVFVTYTVQSAICITILYGTDPVYLIRAVRTEENRTKVTAQAGIWQIVVGTIIGMYIPQMVSKMGVTAHSMSFLALCLAIPLGTIGLLRFFLIPELDTADEQEKAQQAEEDKKGDHLTLKEALLALSGNKFIWIYAFMYFLYHFANGFSGGAATYYFQYNYGDIGLLTWMNAATLFTMIVLIVAPGVMEKLGTGKTLRIGIFIMLLGPVIRMAGGTHFATLIIGQLLFIAGSVPIAFMLNIYLFECIDYGEWKTGTRVEGMMGSITSFTAKIASAINSAVFGFALVAIGFDGKAAEQSERTLNGIAVLYNLVPILICAICLLLSFRYSIGNDMPRIREELAKRNSEAE